jgi:hypothetical protein
MVTALIYLVVYVCVFGLIWWLFTWALARLKVPEPIATVLNVVVTVIFALACIVLLLNFLPFAGLHALR